VGGRHCGGPEGAYRQSAIMNFCFAKPPKLVKSNTLHRITGSAQHL